MNLKFLYLCCIIAMQIVLSPSMHSQTKPKVMVMTDIGGYEPDDQQSLLRLLLYSDQLDIIGLIGCNTENAITNGEVGDKARGKIANMQNVVNAYKNVRSNLQAHSEQTYPSADALLSVIKEGQRQLAGMNGVGSGYSTEGSDWIINELKKADNQPVWFLAWGGINTLSQALWELKLGAEKVSDSELARIIKKIRIYDIAGQDDSGAWIAHTFPGIFYLRSGMQFKAFAKRVDGLYDGHACQDGDLTVADHDWFDDYVRAYSYGSLYQRAHYMYEGDTPSFLYLINNGLSNPEKPHYGSWGGRFKRGVESPPQRSSNPENPDYLPAYVHNNATDNYRYNNANYNNIYTPLWRWRREYQNDFAARVLWTTTPNYAEANHAPRVVVNGNETQDIVHIHAGAGKTVHLSAIGTTDPDGNSLTYQWWNYSEPGTYTDELTVENNTSESASLTIPANAAEGDSLHIILSVTDNGIPALTAYRRVIVVVGNTEPVRILSLGNSITQGQIRMSGGVYTEAYNSYRRPLWKQLESANYNVDFIGSMNTVKDADKYYNETQAPHPNPDFDLDHEGHWGWRADEIDASLTNWLSGYDNSPDIVLLLIGSNDIKAGDTPELVLADIESIIAKLRQEKPSVAILLGSLLPTKDPDRVAGTDAVNALLPDFVSGKNSATSPVILIDHYSSMTTAHLHDNCHPNEEGEIIMAQNWFNGIEAYLNGDPTVPPQAPAGFSIDEVKHNQITLSWTPETILSQSYLIERSTNGGAYEQIAELSKYSASYTDATVSTETQYSYRAYAKNTIGISAPSATVSAVTPQKPDAEGFTVLLNFSNSSSSLPWNKCSFFQSGSGDVFTEVYDTDGNATSIAVTSNSLLQGNSIGVRTYSSDPVFPLDVMRDATYVKSGATLNLLFSGLSTDFTYDLKMTGSRTDVIDDRTTVYTVGAKSGSLNAARNYTDYVLLEDIEADANGTFTLLVSPGASASYGYINGLEMVARPKGETPEAPVAPQNLTAGNATASTIDLAWTPATTGGTASSFIIERSVSGSTFQGIATVGSSKTSFTDDGLGANTSYSYRVFAKNSSGTSSASQIAVARTLNLLTAPEAPTNLIASNISSSSISLTWLAASTGGNADSFIIERSVANGAFTDIAELSASVAEYTDNNLTANTSYTYRIAAKNSIGSSNPSAALTVNTLDVLNTEAFTVLLNFSNPNSSLPWNKCSFYQSGSGDVFTEVYDTDGNATNITVTSNSLLQGNNIGVRTYSTDPVFPLDVLRDATYVSSGATLSLLFSGLSADYTYDLKMTGSRTDVTNDRTTIYTVGTKSGSLDAAGNYTDYVQLNNIEADANGTFTLVVSPGPSASYGYINGLEMVARPKSVTPELPATPQNLTAGNATTSTIDLAWTPAATGGTASSYIIERSVSGASFQFVTEVNASTFAFTDIYLSASTNYTYRISAKNSIGVSSPSLTASATTVPFVTTPGIPTNIKSENVSSSSVSISWLSATTGGQAESYIIERSVAGGTFQLIAEINASTVTYTDSNLASNTNYAYRVTAKNSAGTSAPSASLNITTQETPDTEGFTVLLDFANTSATAPWNSSRFVTGSGDIFNNVYDIDGNHTSICVSSQNNISGKYGGVVTGDNSGIFPDDVLANFNWVDYNNPGELKFSGLSTDYFYTLKITGSRAGVSGVRYSVYTVGQVSDWVDATLNYSDFALLENIEADAAGEFSMSLTCGYSTTYAYINGIELTATAKSSVLSPKSGFETTAIAGANAEVQVGPNPALGSINISSPDLAIKTVLFYDISGKLCQENIVEKNNSQIDVSMLKQGFYYLKLVTSKGSLITKKIMIQN